MDGYGSHTCVPSVLRKFKERRVLMLAMQSHTSHALQPLDVTCFKPTKYFFAWVLRYIFGSRSVQFVQKSEAPFYFELALKEACTPQTIQSGFRTTGLFPFQKDFVDRNPQKFQLADTLDAEKMAEKMFEENGNLSLAGEYKLMHATTEEVSKQISEAGDGFKIQFPHLSESLEKLLDSRRNLELPMREAATILKIPDSTKVKKKSYSSN